MSVVNGMLEADIACLPQGTFYSSIITSSLRNSILLLQNLIFTNSCHYYVTVTLLRNEIVMT